MRTQRVSWGVKVAVLDRVREVYRIGLAEIIEVIIALVTLVRERQRMGAAALLNQLKTLSVSWHNGAKAVLELHLPIA